MAKQVVWTLRAQDDRKKILRYWKLRNKSSTFSKKLNALFKESVKIIVDFPEAEAVGDNTNRMIAHFIWSVLSPTNHSI